MTDKSKNYILLYKLPTVSTNEKYWTISREFKNSYNEKDKKYIQDEILEKKEFILDNIWRSQGESNS